MPLPIGPVEIADHAHTLMSAIDWPMFNKMLGQMQWMFGGLSAIIISLGIYAVRTIKNGFEVGMNRLEVKIASQRKEDGEKCKGCQESHDSNKDEFRFDLHRELDALWEKSNKCCKKVGVVETDLTKQGFREQ